MVHSVLQSPDLQLAADSNQVLNYRRDQCNYITQMFGEQLPAISTGFLNVYLSKGVIVQPHWHTNANELVIVICGEVLTSVFNPFTRKLMTYRLSAGQVAQLPKGWFHWIIALSEQAYLITVFDQPTPDIVYGSDFLRSIPPEVLNLAYCISGSAYAQVVTPIQESVVLGPPLGCPQPS